MKGPENRLLDIVRNGHIVFYCVQATQNKVEYAYLGTRRVREGPSLARRQDTHCPSDVAVELLNDSREAPAGHVQEMPAPAHRLAVPPASRMLAWAGQVAVFVVVEPELDEGPELLRVSEREDDPVFCAHDAGLVGRERGWG